MSVKQAAITLGTNVVFYVTGYKDRQFRIDFKQRTKDQYPLGPYLGVVTGLVLGGKSVNLCVFDACSRPFSRVNVRVLADDEPITEAETDCCSPDMSRARILTDPDAAYATGPEVEA